MTDKPKPDPEDVPEDQQYELGVEIPPSDGEDDFGYPDDNEFGGVE
jgi:hypothetical protein